MVLSLLLTLVVLIGVGSLALNAAWLHCHQIQLRQASEAAALAGAGELLDPYPSGTSEAASEAAAARLTLAKQQAAAFFSHNSSALLRTDGPDADVNAGWCATPTEPGAAVVPWTGGGLLNSMAVRGMRRRSNGQAVILWFGSLFGVGDAEPAAAARASMDQRIRGFRPLQCVNVPMVPLLVASTNKWPSAAPGSAQRRGGGPDVYSVDLRTGAVASGPDGIGEITLQIPLADGGAPPQAGGCWLSLPGGTTDFDALRRQVTDGLTASDLAGTGGEFVLDEDGVLPVLAASTPDSAQAAALHDALLSIRGQRRIWPVGNIAGLPSCQVTGFVAGCVVDCRLDGGQLTLVVEACTFQTCTGVLRSGTARNAWIGKLILNE